MPDRQPLIMAIVGFAIANGIFSPLFLPLMLLLRPFGPAFFLASPTLLVYFTSLVLSTATLILAGIPAAIYERVMHKAESDAVSLWIWLAGTAMLSLPAVVSAVGLAR